MKQPETDLFGAVKPPFKAPNRKLEGNALIEVLRALNAHPCVAWCHRQNTGALRVGARFVKFGWPGCSDILGQLTDGRFLAVECKSKKGKATPEQVAFLERINGNGGLGFIAKNCADVFRALRDIQGENP